jgi:hypothetical protein
MIKISKQSMVTTVLKIQAYAKLMAASNNQTEYEMYFKLLKYHVHDLEDNPFEFEKPETEISLAVDTRIAE